jgi:hypothetical protein
MCPFSAPGPDGVGLGFYAATWMSVKPALMRFLHAFHDEDIDLQRVNRALIILIPKMDDVVTPSTLCPVSLQNCPGQDSIKTAHIALAATDLQARRCGPNRLHQRTLHT